MLSHPQNGLNTANMTKWLEVVEKLDGDNQDAWQLATSYLEKKIILSGGTRLVDLQHQWVVNMEGVWMDLRNPSPQ